MHSNFDATPLIRLAAYDVKTAIRGFKILLANAGVITNPIMVDRIYAEMYFEDGGYLSSAKSLPHFERYLAAHDEPMVRVKYAMALANVGRTDDAFKEAGRAIEIAPENHHAHSVLAIIHLLRAERNPEARELENAAAIKAMSRASELEGGSGIYELGIAQIKAGEGLRSVIFDSELRTSAVIMAEPAREVGRALRRRILFDCMRNDETKLPLVLKTLGAGDLEPDPNPEAAGWYRTTARLVGMDVALRFPLNRSGVAALPVLWLERVRRKMAAFVKSLDAQDLARLSSFEILPERRVWADFRASENRAAERRELFECRLFVPPMSAGRMIELAEKEHADNEMSRWLKKTKRNLVKRMQESQPDIFADVFCCTDKMPEAEGLDVVAISRGAHALHELIETQGVRGALKKLEGLPDAFRSLSVYELARIGLLANEIGLDDTEEADRLSLVATLVCAPLSEAHEWGLRTGMLFAKNDRFTQAVQGFAAANAAEPDEIESLAGLYFVRSSISSPEFAKPFRVRVERFWQCFAEEEGQIRELLNDGRVPEASQLIIKMVRSLLQCCNIAVNEGDDERWELVFTPIESDVTLFILLELKRRMPASLAKHWSFCVGNEPKAMPSGVSLLDRTLSISKMLAYPTHKEGSYDLAIYSPEFRGFTDEELSGMTIVLRKLIEFSIGYAACASWIDQIEAVRQMPATTSTGLALEEFKDYFHEAEPESDGFTFERMAEVPSKYWRKGAQTALALYEDVRIGETVCPALSDPETRADENIGGELSVLEFAGAAAGFFYLEKMTQQASGTALPADGLPPLDPVLAALRDYICAELGPDAVRFVGRASGSRFEYLDFIAWDFQAVKSVAERFFAEPNCISAGMSVFRAGADPIVLCGDAPFDREPIAFAMARKAIEQLEALAQRGGSPENAFMAEGLEDMDLASFFMQKAQA